MPNIKENSIGQIFNKLKIDEFVGKDKNNRLICKCTCECGKEIIKSYSLIIKNIIQSCGCSPKINYSGTYGSREYNSWRHMKSRCYNKNDCSYKYYGERGITICDEWIESFNKFYEDMGECPEGMTLDRIDVNDNYYKENCKWATITDQNRNKRSNILNLERAKFIRELHSKGYSVKLISDTFNIKIRHIYKIINNELWKEDE